MLDDNAANWVSLIDQVAFTHMSPFYLLYGVQAKIPAELDKVPDDTVWDTDTETAAEVVSDRATALADHLNGKREEALSNIAKAQDKQKRQ